MTVQDFARYSEVLHDMTQEFARAVPDDAWDFTPVPARTTTEPPTQDRPTAQFAPFSKQLRHVVCVRGVYNAALTTSAVDWSRKHEHYTGPLTRDALIAGLADQQRRLIALLDGIHPDIVLDWDGSPFTFGLFAGEFVQHEALHHGQWSVYAALAGFDTPTGWRESWGL
ncbi:DinB family protein [Microbacterium sp. NEAU-LLC]|uniref:DinB family protein n=1 Tax=Microbacterium helvum TaxID=2773713 RepID=A0ABR8NPY6_9MICO|nr:DinB family protein [Microbacterium helvum]MBD3942691.1 DinB family protein [Microbacterium helvum]